MLLNFKFRKIHDCSYVVNSETLGKLNLKNS